MHDATGDTATTGTVVHLKDRAVLRVAGPEAHGFLQNLLTCDFEAIDRTGAGYGALLTPQGKILFDFLVFPGAPDEDGNAAYLFDVAADVAADLAKRLTFYKLRSKVGIADVSEGTAVLAAWGAPWDDALPGRAFADPRLPAFGLRVLAPADAVTGDTPPAGFAWGHASAYHARRVALGLPESPVDFALGDSFPHDADMDDLHGVAFDKGCFVGQEVVSRMQHRGTARRRIIQVAGDAALPAPGTEIVAGAKPAGTLGTVDGTRGLALVRLDRIASARAKGEAVTADGVALTAELPDWARFTWPSDTTAPDAS